ncbi:hypothetical protein PGTUg99_000313 [Puccinia graminis f. sp. tritici]|uniref:Uncharacterized protein n=1 Tax=Puccinia graminis f. sp. tritici TaxID=56615 RepID=A0A5B0RNW2_PUCGR|nr:hypothetical protein PGTUg99_000313 [Puccinia graminis f. sp. tritici]
MPTSSLTPQAASSSRIPNPPVAPSSTISGSAPPGSSPDPFPLRDGDVLQLGVDYQGGTEEIYRCVKMRVELNRGWQRSANVFNQQALAQLRTLGVKGATHPPPANNPTNSAALKDGYHPRTLTKLLRPIRL